MSGLPELEAVRAAVRAAGERGDHATALELVDRILAQRPGDDAAHEARARALLALGRLAEAEVDAAAAVRLDPDEVRYRELLAEVLSASGAYREAAEEYARLAQRAPAQMAWTRAEALERLAAGDPERAAQAARRALRLSSADATAQLALAQALLRVGQARPALEAATRAVALAPADAGARETEADALWLAGHEADALAAYAALAREPHKPPVRERAVDRARELYRSRAGLWGRVLAALRPAFAAALRAGRVRLGESSPGAGGSATRPGSR